LIQNLPYVQALPPAVSDTLLDGVADLLAGLFVSALVGTSFVCLRLQVDIKGAPSSSSAISENY
jgi:hypothetical protein